MVTVICYNKEHRFKGKKEAINFFEECLSFCDMGSCEAGRYLYIINELRKGRKEIDDEEMY